MNIIQSLWIGGELSLNEQLCISSFLYHNHEFHLYTYGEVKNVPEGTIIKDANEILPEKDIFQYNKGSYAGFADWFRWKLLYERGNFWVDTDVICLKAFDFKDEVVFGLEDEDFVCPAVLKFPKGHELCKFLESVCRKPNQILPYDNFKVKKEKFKRRILKKGRSGIGWGEAGGPVGFTKALKHFKLFKEAKSFIHFFPVHHSHWYAIYDNTFAEEEETLFKGAYAIHLWNEMTRRRQGFNKNERCEPETLIEKLRRKYLFS